MKNINYKKTFIFIIRKELLRIFLILITKYDLKLY